MFVKEPLAQQKEMQSWLERTNTSLTKAAKQIGLSPATLSLWLAGKYSGNTEQITRRIEKYLSRTVEKAESKRLGLRFVETSVVRGFNGSAKLAHNYGEIVCVTGPAGIGKTVAAKQYAQDNPDVILIEVDPGYSAIVLFSELHKACGFNGKGTIHSMHAECIGKLKDSERLVIIDEAENLNYKSLELLRRLHDKAGVGIVLCGLPRLFSNIRGLHGQFSQLYSRVGGYCKLGYINAEDAEEIVGKFVSVNSDLVDFFYNTAKFGTRALCKLVHRTVMVAGEQNIDRELIKETAEMLIV